MQEQFNSEIIGSIILRSFIKAERVEKRLETGRTLRILSIMKNLLEFICSRNWLKPRLDLTNNLTPKEG